VRRRADAVTLVFAIALAACSSGPHSGMTSVPGRGAIAVEVVPNPIVALRASGKMFEFPFDVIVRETGGQAVTVTQVTATVFGPGGMNLGRESWDAARIRALGFRTDIPARGELRYHFTPRREVPDERFIESLSAELRVEASDDAGSPTSATTGVTMRR